MGRGAGNAPVPRFGRAFSGMDVAINHLKVGQSPIAEQFRPPFIPMVTPDLKQRDPVIDLCVLPQASASLAAAPSLQATQDRCLTIRCVPELPGNDASTMPDSILVRPAPPQILVPTELVNGLPADAAKAGA